MVAAGIEEEFSSEAKNTGRESRETSIKSFGDLVIIYLNKAYNQN